MKNPILLFALISAAFIEQVRASAFLPYLDPIRTEITNQQVILSNAPPVDRPLATALRKALLQVDRTTPTNLVNDTRALASLTATLNKSSLSNTFDPLIRGALGNYVGVISASLNSLSNSLSTAFPSGPHTAANNLIAKSFSSVEGVIENGNTTLATKSLAATTKKLTAINNLVTKAQNAPPGANVVAATVNGSGFKSASRTTQVSYTPATGQAIITGVNGIKGLTIWVFSATPGTTTHMIAGDGSDAYAIYLNGISGQASSTSGTITITVDTIHSVIHGTFSFSASGPTLGNISVTGGSFLVSY
jgi:hypothetical protein